MSKHSKERLVEWYVASAIYVTRTRREPKRGLFVEERFLLVCSESSDQALKKATELAKGQQLRDESLEYDGEPAKEEFVGIRKLISVAPNPLSSSPGTLHDGCELTYSFYTLRTEDDIQKLVDGSSVHITYLADNKPPR